MPETGSTPDADAAREPFEYDAPVPGTSTWAQVSRIGGGTAGQEQAGDYVFVLRDGDATGEVLAQSSNLHMTLPVTHARVARWAFRIYIEGLIRQQPEPDVPAQPDAQEPDDTAPVVGQRYRDTTAPGRSYVWVTEFDGQSVGYRRPPNSLASMPLDLFRDQFEAAPRR